MTVAPAAAAGGRVGLARDHVAGPSGASAEPRTPHSRPAVSRATAARVPWRPWDRGCGAGPAGGTAVAKSGIASDVETACNAYVCSVLS